MAGHVPRTETTGCTQGTSAPRGPSVPHCLRTGAATGTDTADGTSMFETGRAVPSHAAALLMSPRQRRRAKWRCYPLYAACVELGIPLSNAQDLWIGSGRGRGGRTFPNDP